MMLKTLVVALCVALGGCLALACPSGCDLLSCTPQGDGALWCWECWYDCQPLGGGYCACLMYSYCEFYPLSHCPM